MAIELEEPAVTVDQLLEEMTATELEEWMVTVDHLMEEEEEEELPLHEKLC